MRSTGFAPFLLAGLGFFGAIGLLAVMSGLYRQRLYVAGIPFTIAQVVLYYLLVQPQALGDVGTLAMVDKVVQIVLIALLAYLFYAERKGF